MVGIAVKRHFTKPGADPFASIEWTKRTSRITNPDGSVVFEMEDAEIPVSWSQVATDIMVSKYFRKAGVPQTDADPAAVATTDDMPVFGPERSAKQVIHRLAGCWRWWGEQQRLFRDGGRRAGVRRRADLHARAPDGGAELAAVVQHRACAMPTASTGPAQGHYYVDPGRRRS